MALPNIAVPSNRETLPEAGTKIKIRPMVGQEFEILLAAKESTDEETILESTFDVLDSIVVEPPNFDSRSLSSLDFDFVFTKLMILSSGKSTHDLDYLCKNKVEHESNGSKGKVQCKGNIRVSIDLEKDVIYEKPDDSVSREVDVDGRYKIILSDVKASDIVRDGTNMFDRTANAIERLVDTKTNEEWKFKGMTPDVSPDEALEFTKKSLSSTALKEIAKYFRSAGNMAYESKHKCPKCGHDHDIKLRGFVDFFTSASVDIT